MLLGACTMFLSMSFCHAALKVIGVAAAPGMDEFDTVGLGKYRNFWDHFEKNYQ